MLVLKQSVESTESTKHCLVGVCKLKTRPQTQLAKVIMPQPTDIVVYKFLLMNYPKKKESSDALDVLVIEGRQFCICQI